MLYQRISLATSEPIGEPGPLPADLLGGLTDADLAVLGTLGPAEHYVGLGFLPVEPDPAPAPVRRLARIAFLQRLPPLKRIGIRTAAKTDVFIEDFLDLLSATDLIELDHADTLAGVGYLISQSLLTQEEAETLLA